MITRTGYQVKDIGNALSWSALNAFIKNVGFDSAIARELYPDHAAWGAQLKTNVILADLYDVLVVINSNLVAIGSGKRPKQPKPYPRPGADTGEKKIGKGAVTHDDLVAFFKHKRRAHG